MKRGMSIFILCSLVFLITVGATSAGNPDYAIIEYWTQVAPTIDGVWTVPNEWLDGQHVQISDIANFTYTADINAGYASQFFVTFFNDTTDDAEDFWQICIDPSNGGGSTPGTGYGRIDIIGHTDIVCYAGDGSGWTEIAVDTDIEWADALTDSSPLNSTTHWILELQFNKIEGAMQLNQPPNGLRIACYDASNPDAGVQSWPPDSSVDVPDEWGVIPTYSPDPIPNPIPEGLSFGVMAVVSSVAMLAGSYHLRKRSKLEK
jgi:hypothetical protein